jgi:hypothetical protein
MRDPKAAGQRVKFGQLADCLNDRVDSPSQAGVDRYVGLEHLDPESLAIRRWGTPDDVQSTKLRFRPGDIIFGKRRAYQRKLAVADFEGICSAHAMVLRARPGVVLSAKVRSPMALILSQAAYRFKLGRKSNPRRGRNHVRRRHTTRG